MAFWMCQESPAPLFSGDGLELVAGLLYALSPSSVKVMLSLVLHRATTVEEKSGGGDKGHHTCNPSS